MLFLSSNFPCITLQLGSHSWRSKTFMRGISKFLIFLVHSLDARARHSLRWCFFHFGFFCRFYEIDILLMLFWIFRAIFQLGKKCEICSVSMVFFRQKTSENSVSITAKLVNLQFQLLEVLQKSSRRCMNEVQCFLTACEWLFEVAEMYSLRIFAPTLRFDSLLLLPTRRAPNFVINITSDLPLCCCCKGFRQTKVLRNVFENYFFVRSTCCDC